MMSSMEEPLQISFSHIVFATNDFDEKNKIAAGGFGKVYQGYSERYGSVAVKRLDHSKSSQGQREFMMEIQLLSAYKHENLVSLVGFCDQDEEKILVYKLESNGSLDKLLQREDLDWIQRLRICLDAAKGLKYLHHDVGPQRKVVHRDVKSSNILLDENLKAKISDFGLSKISPTSESCSFLISNGCGTMGYVDPEYAIYGILTEKSDVYSFGVVLFEVLCGRLAIVVEYEDRRRFLFTLAVYHFDKNTLHKIIYPNLQDQMDPDSLKTFSTIAYNCLTKGRKDRPSMSQIVEQLQKALDQQLAASSGLTRPGAALQQGLPTSASLSSQPWKYDVYLSFKKKDTRNNFVDHLYSALVQQGIRTYLFDQTVSPGQSISSSGSRGIEESRIAIIVISKNYAASSWCMDELAYIMECNRYQTGLTIIPIFYHTDPSEIYKNGVALPELLMWKSEDRVESWRKALHEVCCYRGWVTEHEANGHTMCRHEATLIRLIVDAISNEFFPNKDRVEMGTDHLTIPHRDMLLASSSSSSSQTRNHDVFVSFMGEDTRKTFVDHLYSALAQKRIDTYQDEEPIPSSGKAIAPSLLKAIEESKIAVIVLSENYAYSTRCLNELVYIMKRNEARCLFVMPIFYHVSPSQVLNQNRPYVEEHESENKDIDSAWERALRQVCNLSGFTVNGPEAKLVKEIVDTISNKLLSIKDSKWDMVT